METMWAESDARTPLICFLSMGSDPTENIERLAKSKGISEELHHFFLFQHNFCAKPYVPRNPEGTQVIVGSMNMGYISDTARNRTHKPVRPKWEPIPLGHSDGHIISTVPHFRPQMLLGKSSTEINADHF